MSYTPIFLGNDALFRYVLSSFMFDSFLHRTVAVGVFSPWWLADFRSASWQISVRQVGGFPFGKLADFHSASWTESILRNGHIYSSSNIRFWNSSSVSTTLAVGRASSRSAESVQAPLCARSIAAFQCSSSRRRLGRVLSPFT